MALYSLHHGLVAAMAVAAAQAHLIPAPAGCTTTSNITQTMFATPPYWPTCEFDGTLHQYPAYVTETASVDCGGCDHIRVQTVPQVFCPNKFFTATVCEETPYTVQKTVCLPTPAP
ncbi:hypothetical protein LLEC1_05636 [Akanthomyces lecanii]|uniref:Uncharacterized protein n=1 Tax=Cordyceps confragosa TaxID=2714763 RepID=A0A179I6J8_CORDF|nr:hypothetical protein LLEC1_05636 [Akanthomyces lecanii]